MPSDMNAVLDWKVLLLSNTAGFVVAYYHRKEFIKVQTVSKDSDIVKYFLVLCRRLLIPQVFEAGVQCITSVFGQKRR